jgi:uncharacterized membrane protein
MSRVYKLVLVLLVGVVLAIAPTASAAQPKFKSVNYPTATVTYVYGINASGEMVGSWYDAAGISHRHGFLLSHGIFTALDYPEVGTTWTEAWGINERGDIVGQYSRADKTIHGFLLHDGNYYPVDVPGQPNTMVVKISANGAIVGCYHVNNLSGGTILNTMYGFSLTGEGVTSYPAAFTMHNGVNEDGDIVGLLYTASDSLVHYSYLVHEGVTTYFQFPEAVVTQAWDISSTGAIVGFYRFSMTLPIHGFLREGGVMTSVDVPGASQTRAYGINARGDIVGYYVDGIGTHGFLLSRRAMD